MKIKNRKIGPGEPCFIVAEISGNHNQRFSEAVKLVRAAARSGADAVKLQTYTAETITLNSDAKWFRVGERVGSSEGPKQWKGKTLHQLFSEAYTPWEWQPKLQKIAEGLGLIFFSSVFDETSVDFLERLKVPCYKVASYEVTDIPLLKKVARTKKPVIISVGFASLQDITLALKTLRANGTKDIALLHCVTDYLPSPDATSVNLSTIPELRKRFKVVAGFSDNNGGIEVPIMAVLSGASIIEKHLILNHSTQSPDSRFSITPFQLKQMVQSIREAEHALGEPYFGPRNNAEVDYRKSRKSLFVVKDISKGQQFKKEHVRSIRPGFGLHPKFFEDVLGKKAARDIKRGTPLSKKLIAPR